MTIHGEHPFPTAEDPARRLRGRLGGAVTLWTAGGPEDRAGLTVSSAMIAAGEPAVALALLDPDSDLAERLRETGRAVLHLLTWPDRDLADAFAGTVPAPGGPFRLREWEQTGHGPRLAERTWAALELQDSRSVGWSLLAEARIADLGFEDGGEPLEHWRGRYRHAGDRGR